MTIPPFTEKGYVETIRSILNLGYALRDFHEVDPTQRHLVLRHDVDQSIQIARRMAAIETENGWSSTWFVLMRTEMYNPWSRDAAACLRDMIADGHEIGLHLDATQYLDQAALSSGAFAECSALEQIIGAPVRMISGHRPANHLIGVEGQIAGRDHAYMARFIKEMGYCSDSRGEWRYGHPWNHQAVYEGRALQLLTHAVWWVGPEGGSARDRLRNVLADAAARLEAELATNNAAWRAAEDIRSIDRSYLESKIESFVEIGSDVVGEYWRDVHFLLELEAKFDLSIMACFDELPIGYAFVSLKSNNTAHLHRLVVSKMWRGKGLGARLLSASMARCNAMGIKHYTVNVARANTFAQRFYERSGFSVSGERGDLLLMSCELKFHLTQT